MTFSIAISSRALRACVVAGDVGIGCALTAGTQPSAQTQMGPFGENAFAVAGDSGSALAAVEPLGAPITATRDPVAAPSAHRDPLDPRRALLGGG